MTTDFKVITTMDYNGTDLAVYEPQQVTNIDPFEDRHVSVHDAYGPIGYSDHRKLLTLIDRHRDEFEGKQGFLSLRTPGGIQKVRTLNYDGLILATMLARTDKAKQFREWAIRVLRKELLKHYGYSPEGEQKPLSASDFVIPNEDPYDSKWWVETTNLLRAQQLIPNTDYYTHMVYQRMQERFGRARFYEPRGDNFIPLTESFFSFLVNDRGWTKDCFIYRYPAYIRNAQDFKEWCERARIKPPARHSCPDERNQKEIAKQHLVKYKSKQELAYLHKTTLNCVNSSIKHTKAYVQDGLDQYRKPSDNNLPYPLYIGGYRFKQKGKIFKGVLDACGNPNCTREIVGPSELHVHHRNYLRVGQELVDDLVPLCEECHNEAHLKDTNEELRHQHDQNGQIVLNTPYFGSPRPNAPVPPNIQVVKTYPR